MLAEATWPGVSWVCACLLEAAVEVAGRLFFAMGMGEGGRRPHMPRLCVKLGQSFSVFLSGKAPFAQRGGSGAGAVDGSCEAKEGFKET